ncbi:DUF1348 family protein [Streptomyces sp. NPDC059506]|uniref:DUF1348 family protein n=1 Tax=Streptomyces sp. NPDC059506 TaxID=3347751 RepID=UPI0036A0059B
MTPTRFPNSRVGVFGQRSPDSGHAVARTAQDTWNTRDPARVALACTEDSEWRGREEIVEFLTAKREREPGYRLRKELWACTGDRIAVRFEYEYHDASGQWFRAYGNENREFDANGLMRRRYVSVNDPAVAPEERRIAV